MKILIVAATGFEIADFVTKMEKEGSKRSFFEYEYLGHNIFPLVTGVGSMQTAFALARFPQIKEIDLAINVGVCGAFDRSLHLGDVLEIEQDRFADLGVEESDGNFTDVYEMELENANRFPLKEAWVNNQDLKYSSKRQRVKAITVNKVSGTQSSIERIEKKYSPQTESMEGAAFLFACKAMDVDCIQLRAISNYVEPRNKENWKLPEALESLNKVLLNYLADLNIT